MIIFFIGYFALGLIFLFLRFFYHISKKNFIAAIKKDFFNVRDYYKKIIFSNPVKFKIIAGLIIIFFIAANFQIENLIIFDDFVSSIVFFLMLIIFAPREDNSNKNFPSKFSVLFIQS